MVGFVNAGGEDGEDGEDGEGGVGGVGGEGGEGGEGGGSGRTTPTAFPQTPPSGCDSLSPKIPVTVDVTSPRLSPGAWKSKSKRWKGRPKKANRIKAANTPTDYECPITCDVG